MSQENVIRNVDFGDSVATSTRINRAISGLSVKANTKFFFNDHLLEDAMAEKIIAIIQANKGLCVQEFADEYIKRNKLDGACKKTQQKIANKISKILAETSVGHTLTTNLFVKLAPMGPRGKWFFNLSEEVQALVERRTFGEQAARVGYKMDTSVPVVLGSAFTGFRKDYLAPTGLGSSRWLSQVNLRSIASTDVKMVAFAKVDARVREERAEAEARAAQATADLRTAQSEAQRAMASVEAQIAEQTLKMTDLLSAFTSAAAGAVSAEVPDDSIEIRQAPVAPAINKLIRRRSRRRPNTGL